MLATLCSLQRRLIYFPLRQKVPPAASVLPGAEDVTFQTEDGLRLNGWFISASAPGHRAAPLISASATDQG